jgi:TetR/AcrR family transcriptional regulator, regulator of cefoperazone and chloramphenicol sensitivity
VTRDSSARGRILAAAERLFADRGFRKVTVRDICRAARVNVAAVNYHFGDKLRLYGEVLESAADVMRETTEVARQAGEGLPSEERLRRYLGIFVGRLLAAGGSTRIHRLIHREMNDPTPALDRLVEKGVRPRIEYLAGLVAEITGRKPTDPRVIRCVFSIQAQSIASVPNPITARLGFPITSADARVIADHIAAFSLDGIRGLRRDGRRSKKRA